MSQICRSLSPSANKGESCLFFFFTYDCSGWGVSSGHVCALQRPSVSVYLTTSFSLTHPFSAAQPVPLKVVLLALFCSTATCDASPSPGWTLSSEQGALASASSSGPKKGAEVFIFLPLPPFCLGSFSWVAEACLLRTQFNFCLSP